MVIFSLLPHPVISAIGTILGDSYSYDDDFSTNKYLTDASYSVDRYIDVSNVWDLQLSGEYIQWHHEVGRGMSLVNITTVREISNAELNLSYSYDNISWVSLVVYLPGSSGGSIDFVPTETSFYYRYMQEVSVGCEIDSTSIVVNLEEEDEEEEDEEDYEDPENTYCQNNAWDNDLEDGVDCGGNCKQECWVYDSVPQEKTNIFKDFCNAVLSFFNSFGVLW